MTYGSLFSGIGGLDLALDRAGFVPAFQCECEPYCQAVLKLRWPGVRRYGDVKEIRDEGCVDVLCGGFPCQPTSVAGKRGGKHDARWLWPEFAHVIRLVRPRYALVENPPGLLSSNRGREMGEVLGELAEDGYDAEWTVLSAAQFGALHLRERVFLVAYRAGEQARGPGFARECGGVGEAADSDGEGWRGARSVEAREEDSAGPHAQPARPDGGAASYAPAARYGEGQSEARRTLRHEARGPESERQHGGVAADPDAPRLQNGKEQDGVEEREAAERGDAAADAARERRRGLRRSRLRTVDGSCRPGGQIKSGAHEAEAGDHEAILSFWSQTPQPWPPLDGSLLNPEWCEWFMGFPPGWTDVEWPGTQAAKRRLRIAALGNAVVPQCAEVVGRLLYAAAASQPAGSERA